MLKTKIVYPIILSLAIISTGLLSSCESSSKYSNDDAGVKQLAADLRKTDSQASAALLATLKPTLEDCKAIVSTEEAAQMILTYADDLYANIPDGAIKGKESQTEILVLSASSESLLDKTDKNLAGGYQINDIPYNKGLKVYQFAYVEPGKTSGMRFDGLIYVNNKWVFVPKFWRAFK